MIYTELTQKAMKIAYKAHRDQTDKSGVPYIFHPIHLAEQMTDEATTCVALLHDVVEDTEVTLEDLRAAGFPAEVSDAICLMTHDEAVPYLDYVRKIKENPIATVVKLADLKHNSDTTRLAVVDGKELARVEKYRKAMALLTDTDGTR